MDPLISIIVPVYNVEKYLPRCLDSLAFQTLKEIEIILVDDGSTDNSGDLCDRYAEKDPRFHVIHQESAGLSAARNRGMEASRADWLMFVDSDDYVSPDFCLAPYTAARNQGADLVFFRRWRVTQHDIKLLRVRGSGSSGCKTRPEAISMLSLPGIGYAVWNKLYKKSLFSGVRFPEGKGCEDLGTTYKTVLRASAVWYLDQPLYYHVQRPGSITATPRLSQAEDRYELYTQMLRDLESAGCIQKGSPEYRVRLYNMSLRYLIRAGLDMPHSAECGAVLRCTPLFGARFSKWWLKGMFWLYRLSPAAFDRICVRKNRRGK